MLVLKLAELLWITVWVFEDWECWETCLVFSLNWGQLRSGCLLHFWNKKELKLAKYGVLLSHGFSQTVDGKLNSRPATARYKYLHNYDSYLSESCFMCVIWYRLVLWFLPLRLFAHAASYLYPSFQGLMSDNDTVRLGLDFQRMLRINHMLYIAARSVVMITHLLVLNWQIIRRRPDLHDKCCFPTDWSVFTDF